MTTWHDFLVEDDEGIRKILQEVKHVAVIGIKDESHQHEAAHSVPKYLKEHGYKISAVNPKYDTVFGETCYNTIAEVGEEVDLVLIFRAPGNFPAHAEEVLELSHLPMAVWMQSGITSMNAAHVLAAKDIKVVQDHCIYRDHLRLIGDRELVAA